MEAPMKSLELRILTGLLLALPMIMVILAVGRYLHWFDEAETALLFSLAVAFNMGLSVCGLLAKNASATTVTDVFT